MPQWWTVVNKGQRKPAVNNKYKYCYYICCTMVKVKLIILLPFSDTEKWSSSLGGIVFQTKQLGNFGLGPEWK